MERVKEELYEMLKTADRIKLMRIKFLQEKEAFLAKVSNDLENYNHFDFAAFHKEMSYMIHSERRILSIIEKGITNAKYFINTHEERNELKSILKFLSKAESHYKGMEDRLEKEEKHLIKYLNNKNLLDHSIQQNIHLAKKALEEDFDNEILLMDKFSKENIVINKLTKKLMIKLRFADLKDMAGKAIIPTGLAAITVPIALQIIEHTQQIGTNEKTGHNILLFCTLALVSTLFAQVRTPKSVIKNLERKMIHSN